MRDAGLVQAAPLHELCNWMALHYVPQGNQTMTAETDLLPLPDWMECLGEISAADIRAYAHANVARATAPLQAEIEALRAQLDEQCRLHAIGMERELALITERDRLRAEVERLTFEMGCLRQQYDERTSCMIVHRGAALACSDSVRAAYYDEHHRADKLAEALRELRDLMLGQVKWMPCDCGCPQQRTPDGPHSVTWLRAAQQVDIAIGKARRVAE